MVQHHTYTDMTQPPRQIEPPFVAVAQTAWHCAEPQHDC